MKYLGLLLITYCMLMSAQHHMPLKQSFKIPVNTNYAIYSSKTAGFFNAIITGDKSKLPYKTKKVLKIYGLSHILTPSGIHLSSLIVIARLVPFIETALLILLFGLFSFGGGYYSIVRVIIFRLINKFSSIKDPEIVFLITIAIAFLLGHFSKSPLSISYSFLFWGTIILFRSSPLKIILYLHLSLCFVSSIQGAAINPLSVLINPIFTAIFSFFFPIFFLSYALFPIHFLQELSHFIIDKYLYFLHVAHQLNPFEVYTPTTYYVLVAIIFINSKHRKLIMILLLLQIKSLNTTKQLPPADSIISPGYKSEILYMKKGWIHFIDQKCIIIDTQMNCKKKPSNLGGPKI